MEIEWNNKKTTICERCILPETLPGIKLDDGGICNFCLKEEAMAAKKPAKKSEYLERLDRLIESVRGKAPTYDAITAYSGGKDSSYTLKILQERYDLRVLALTFDNHFISEAAWKNIQLITDILSIDHIGFKPPKTRMKKMFSLTAREDIFSPATLLRASSICTACIGIVKSLVLKTALEGSIPLLVFGWSPGQAPIQSALMKNNPAMIRLNQSALIKAFPGEIYREIAGYFLPDSYYDRYKERFPHNIHPLAFFDYNEKRIMEDLVSMGWKPPDDTDANSSNCLLNAFANYCHIERHEFHPYVWEIANMVRQGVVNRKEGIEKIYSEQDPLMVGYARKKLIT